jgi:hypothetical protein
MPKFLCSYAYDVPAYQDFVVEAETQAQADQLIQAALEDGSFSNVVGDLSFEDAGQNERVWVHGPATKMDNLLSLADLLEESKTT